eukprot:gnl/MRDRNA2_/MRDRNA2_86341_c0_seq1.p1 gnl/MRDRNA2_/MRDRNA2_86341_c0~~gnl/MRDRNA2_/MRDRNA2_86341_c0_seq1.p1  ORF type:complete len:456 (+),score=38.28 gnl/MRDRNA2_/MRDRNA2_86341_c0_seq1:331-1698(+)
MEGVANSVEDKLIDGLSFKHKPGASYVTERKSVTFHPQGSNIYSTNGTKLVKILLTGDQWMDPSTLRIMFDVLNTGTSLEHLRVLGGPHTFFRRMRILCGGQVVEDIDNYNRVHEMFSTLKAQDTNANDDAEGFGDNWTFDTTMNTNVLPGIIAGQSQTVLFKPCSGLFNQSKMLPIRYMPITIELELVNNSTEPIVSDAESDFTVSGTNPNTSTSWQLQNVQVKVDTVTLDNQLDNSYAEHLLSGKALPINYQTYVSQMTSIQGGSNGTTIYGQQKVRLSITRALSRLKNVFITLDKAVSGVELVKFKPWNSFYSPMHDYVDNTGSSFDNTYDSDGEIADFQISVGSKNFPEYPIRSLQEAYYQLRKTLGVHDQHNSIDISQKEYRRRKFILGVDMEKVLEAGFTGINTRAGDIMQIRFDHKTGLQDRWATSLHTVLTADCILEVRDNGVQVFD